MSATLLVFRVVVVVFRCTEHTWTDLAGRRHPRISAAGRRSRVWIGFQAEKTTHSPNLAVVLCDLKFLTLFASVTKRNTILQGSSDRCGGCNAAARKTSVGH